MCVSMGEGHIGSIYIYIYIGGVYLCLVPLDGPPDARGIHEPDHALRRRISREVRELLVALKGQRIVPWMRPIPVLTCPSAPPPPPPFLPHGRATYEVHLRQQKHGVMVLGNIPRRLQLIHRAPQLLPRAADRGALDGWRRCIGGLFQALGIMYEDDGRGLFCVVDGLAVEACA